MTIIRVPPPELRAAASSMTRRAEEIGGLLDRILSGIKSLDSRDVWSGRSARAYVDEVNELVPKVKADLDRLIVEGLAPDLERIASQFEELDAALGGR